MNKFAQVALSTLMLSSVGGSMKAPEVKRMSLLDHKPSTVYVHNGKKLTPIYASHKDFHEDIQWLINRKSDVECKVPMTRSLCLDSVQTTEEQKKILKPKIRSILREILAGYASATAAYHDATNPVDQNKIFAQRREEIASLIRPIFQDKTLLSIKGFQEALLLPNDQYSSDYEIIQLFDLIAFHIDIQTNTFAELIIDANSRVPNKSGLVTETVEKSTISLAPVLEHYRKLSGDMELINPTSLEAQSINTRLSPIIDVKEEFKVGRSITLGHVTNRYRGVLFQNLDILDFYIKSGTDKKLEQVLENHEAWHILFQQEVDNKLGDYLFTPEEQQERVAIDELLAFTRTNMTRDIKIVMPYLRDVVINSDMQEYEYARNYIGKEIQRILIRKMRSAGKEVTLEDFLKWDKQQKRAAYREHITMTEIDEVLAFASAAGKKKLHLFLSRLSKNMRIQEAKKQAVEQGHFLQLVD